ncbi:TPA: EamA family transporter [Candidatus Woesearchaeota archaeon]|nr:EamA family transporter [Candidatus Woesearchaeota archaeon]
MGMAELWAISLVLVSTVIGSVGSLFLKLGSAHTGSGIRSFIFNRRLILGFFLYGLSAALFIPALKGGDLSLLYPLVSLAYIWILLLSVKYLRERINAYRVTGIALIMLGVVLIGAGS